MKTRLDFLNKLLDSINEGIGQGSYIDLKQNRPFLDSLPETIATCKLCNESAKAVEQINHEPNCIVHLVEDWNKNQEYPMTEKKNEFEEILNPTKEDLLSYLHSNRTDVVEVDLDHEIVEFFVEKAKLLSELSGENVDVGDAIGFVITQICKKDMINVKD